MRTRQLGTGGPVVSALGLGAMSFSSVYGPSDDNESIRTIHAALELGVTLIDTADAYGGGHNEKLVARAIQGKRDRVVLATKFGLVFNSGMAVDGRPEHVKRSIEGSLKRLETDYVDLYYLHRVDPNTPIEETVGAMGELVTDGKVRHIGLSEAGAETLRRATRAHPIAAVQSEYSLWTRDGETAVIPATRELGIGFVAYSPLGRGWLTGSIRSLDDIPEDDFRRTSPQFAPENFAANLALADRIREMAREKGAEPAQLALAWLLAQGDEVVPIFGTRRKANLENNLGALRIELSERDLAAIDEAAPAGRQAGQRWATAFMSQLNG